MVGGHKPRSGSLAYYPRVRAKKATTNFTTYPVIDGDATNAINFFGYKAGMTQIFAKNSREKSTGFGQEVCIPATVVECPPVKVIGVRAYKKTTYGLKVLGEATIEKPGKNLRKRIVAFKKSSQKNKKTKTDKSADAENKKEESEKKAYPTLADIEKFKETAEKVVLIVEVQISATGIGKKKSDVGEISLSGSIEQQFAFAKEKFGKELRVSEIFAEDEEIDVKAITKGKGFQGPVKRFGVKIQRPKAKKQRAVGSISPWHPATVMWTVPRPGQMGYHTRTEYNKKIILIDNNKGINPAGGFSNYGEVKNDFIVLAGSIPGPVKREIALRKAIRKVTMKKKYADIKVSFERKSEENAHAEAKEEAKA